eukprot:SAG31_NODE_7769_length_1601_cov_1.312250_2_plen_71_part_00
MGLQIQILEHVVDETTCKDAKAQRDNKMNLMKVHLNSSQLLCERRTEFGLWYSFDATKQQNVLPYGQKVQ